MAEPLVLWCFVLNPQLVELPECLSVHLACRSITVHFFTRAPGPPGLRNPEWLLMVRAVKLTLVGVQPRQLAGESSAAGSRLPFWGQARIPEAIGVFTADLSGDMPSQ